MRWSLIGIIFLLAFHTPDYGQQNLFGDKAQKFYQQGLFFEINHQPERAIKAYRKSLAKDSRNPQAYLALASLYERTQDYDQASKILQSCKVCSPLDQLRLAEDLFRNRSYNESGKVLDALNRSVHKKDLPALRMDLLSKSLRLVQADKIHDKTVNPENLGPRINTVYDEYFPSISLDDSILVFTRKTNGEDQDFYQAYRDSCGGWFQSLSLPEPPNSPSQEGAAMLSADGHYLFFTRCENRSPNGWALGGCDLYFSYTVPGGWSQPVPFGATINTPAYEGMPSLSPDNKTMYFVSDRPGGYGGKDIWMSHFKDGLWQVPENLGPKVNTQGNETSPWIAVDNETLYFTSDGLPGYGGTDLYYCRRDKDGNWGAPANLGAPINSPSDEMSMTIRNDGQKAYFASNRPGGIGGTDIYETELPDDARPQPRTMVYGVVQDSLRKTPLHYAILNWVDLNTGKVLSLYQSNRGDGSYISAFPLHVKLGLEVSRYNYLTFHDTLVFDSARTYPPDTLNISLLPVNYSPPLSDTNLMTVYFDKNKVSLDNDSVLNRIKKVVTPFVSGKYNEFIVNGFTDTSGYRELNEDISVQRAAFIRDVLVAIGIPFEKIDIKGWADSSPLDSNSTEEGRARNRRAVIVLRKP